MRTAIFNRMDTQSASIKLFHAVVDNQSKQRATFADMLKYGIVLVDKNGAVSDIDSSVSRVIVDTLGLKPINWAQSFHKSWNVVATASAEQLLSEQILHYFSTYGLEALGLRACSYIPVEKILIDLTEKPAIEAFTVVRVISEQELQDELVSFLKSTKAPHRDAIESIKMLLPLAEGIAVDDIKSFELKIIYCELKGLVPLDAQDFLRFAVYKATGATTLVKDAKTIEALKMFAKTVTAEQMFDSADLVALSESFYRFKPLFLAFKHNSKLAPAINRIRRLATKHHKAVSGLTASNLMNILVEGRQEDALAVISRADNRELIKLINFARYEIAFRNLESGEHIYTIRNGKTFVKTDDRERQSDNRFANLTWMLAECRKYLEKRLSNAFSGKVFYIPKEFKYAAPVSEKQMLDVLPYGSKIVLPSDAKAICVSGHWFNSMEFNPYEHGRIDLDFHLESACGSVGWNSNYRTGNRDILFSGDMTDAPEPYGAVESFRIADTVEAPYELSVNAFNAQGAIPYELLFTKDLCDHCDFTAYSRDLVSAVVNPANAITPPIKLHMQSTNDIIGYYYNKSFTIYGGGLGNARVPDKSRMIDVLKASICRCDNMMDIAEVISLAGGIVTHEIPTDGHEYVDLSVGALTSTTLFNVVDGKSESIPLAVAKISA